MALLGNLTQIVISAVDKTKAAFASAKAGLTGLGSAASSLRSNMGTLFAGLGILAFIGQIKSAVNAMDEAGKSAQKVGTSVENFSALTFAASQSNVSVESLEKGLVRLNRSLDDAKGGTGAAADAFRRLNIDPAKFKDPADALVVLADAFAKMPDGVNKTALAVAIFGKSGAEMIPLLNQGSAGIRAMTEEAKQLGVVFDEQAAAAAEKLNDNLDKLATASKGLHASLAREAVGPLTQITNAMTEAAKSGGLLEAAWVGLGGIGAAAFTHDLETLEQRLRRLREEFDSASTGLFVNQDNVDAIGKQIKETERLIESERQAYIQRQKQSKKTADSLGENRAQETKEFKASIDEQIKDSERLESALQAAFSTALKTEQDYMREARKLRADATKQTIDPNDIEAQASAKLDAIIALQKLQRTAPTDGLDNVREQADNVRSLAENLADAALKSDLLKQANLAEAAALDKAAAEEKARAEGLAQQQDLNSRTIKDLTDGLELLKKGAQIDIKLGSSVADTLNTLELIKFNIDYINNTPLTANTGAAALSNIQDAALKRGVRP